MKNKHSSSSTVSTAKPFGMEFMLKSIDDSISFKIGADTEDDLKHFFYAFLAVFPGVLNAEERKINALATVSEQLRDNLKDFVATHERRMKGLNAVEAFVRKLSDGEIFYVIPDFQPNTEETTRLHHYLKAKGDTQVFEQLNAQMSSLFGELFRDYNVTAYGYKRLTIGEKDKAKVICRFCNRGVPEVTFKKRAHAVSEALGNKNLILTEECDECNERFAVSIEPALVEYLGLERALYDIKGKGGSKEYHGENFEITRNTHLEIHYRSEKDTEDEDLGSGEVPQTIVLKSNKLICKQDIYRALVKFALSVIEHKWLTQFQKTVAWVRGEFDCPRLPLVAVFFFAEEPAMQPTLTLYIRKTADTSLPFAVAEFRYARSRYCFILPCSDSDQQTFTEKESYAKFWGKFKHYHSLENKAKFLDLSDPFPKEFQTVINFELRKTSTD